MKPLNSKKSVWLNIVLLFAVAYVSTAKTITSAPSGGAWNTASTWIGGEVPGETDDVIITSTVNPDGGSYSYPNYKVRNVTIQAGGKLIREPNTGGVSFLTAYGDFINNGQVTDNADAFDIHLHGKFENNGKLKVRNISMKGSGQSIKMTEAIQAVRLTLEMTDDNVVAMSDLEFRNCFITGKKTLVLGSNNLYLTAEQITYDGYYGTISSPSKIDVPIVLSQGAVIDLDNSILASRVNGNLTISSPTFALLGQTIVDGNFNLTEGTKLSSDRWMAGLEVYGNFSNYGDISNDSIDVKDGKAPKRPLNIFVFGDYYNLSTIGSSKLTMVTEGNQLNLVGDVSGELILKQSLGSEKPGGEVVIKNDVDVYGKLTIEADLRIAKSGILNLLYRDYKPISLRNEFASLVVDGTLINYHYINNDGYYSGYNEPGTSIEYGLRDWDGTLEGIEVKVVNNQPYPSLPGTVKRWWRLKEVGDAKVTKYTAKFYYDEELLNGQKESDLRVYHSTDEGETWEMVTFGEYAILDTDENSISIGVWHKDESMLKSLGDFVISAGDGTVPIASPIKVDFSGRSQVRLGVPNRYTGRVYNLTNSRTESFMLAITISDEIVFDSYEFRTKDGIVTIPHDSTGERKDHSELFFVPFLEPYEEYSFDFIVKGVKDGEKGVLSGVQSLTFTGLGKFAAKEKFEDKVIDKINKLAALNEKEEREYARALGLTVKELRALRENKEGPAITPIKTMIKYGVEKASKTNPVTSLIYKIGEGVELVSKVKDSFRQRIFHWFYKETGLYGVEETKVVSGKSKQTEIVTSWDPNEKQGPIGYGDENFISEVGKMNYTILFENKKEATAAAYKIEILDTLSSNFNLSTVKFGPTSHEGGQYNWQMNRNGNILRWYIEGIELPPNKIPPEGEGYVTFSVDLKDGLQSGERIENKATIIFDENDPITTNTWVNILDTIPPTTAMNKINYIKGDTTVMVSCSSTDNANGSGINKYLYYVSIDNGPYTFIGESFESSIEYRVHPERDSIYRFYAISTDNVENQEILQPEVVKLDVKGTTSIEVVESSTEIEFYPNPVNDKIYIEIREIKLESIKYEILSLNGKKMSNGIIYPISKNTFEMDISQFEVGIYFIKLYIDDGVKTLKFVKI